MKIIIETEYDLLQLQYLFTDSTKGKWILEEGHEWMFRIRHVETHREITIETLRLSDNFREKIKDWMVENIYLWPHPNSPRQSENKQYQEEAYARFLNRQFVKHLEKASKQVDEWPEWKRIILGGVKPPPRSTPAPEHISYYVITYRPIKEKGTSSPGGFE